MFYEGFGENVEAVFGLVKVGPNFAAEEFVDWQRKIQKNHASFYIREVDCRVTDAIEELVPILEVAPSRAVFLATKSDWSVYLNNSFLGTDAVGSMKILGKSFAVASMSVVIQRYDADRSFQGRTLELYDGDFSIRRAIGAIK